MGEHRCKNSIRCSWPAHLRRLRSSLANPFLVFSSPPRERRRSLIMPVILDLSAWRAYFAIILLKTCGLPYRMWSRTTHSVVFRVVGLRQQLRELKVVEYGSKHCTKRLSLYYHLLTYKTRSSAVIRPLGFLLFPRLKFGCFCHEVLLSRTCQAPSSHESLASPCSIAISKQSLFPPNSTTPASRRPGTMLQTTFALVDNNSKCAI